MSRKVTLALGPRNPNDPAELLDQVKKLFESAAKNDVPAELEITSNRTHNESVDSRTGQLVVQEQLETEIRIAVGKHLDAKPAKAQPAAGGLAPESPQTRWRAYR